MYKRQGVVTAGDIKADGEVEVLNPELVIATMSSEGKLYMEITLSKGRGYVPADRNAPNVPQAIGVIPIDSIYTPVYKANYTVENTRVGNVTDYDKLTLEVYTNKTIDADEALSLAAKIMSEHLNLFIDLSDEAKSMDVMIEKEVASKEKAVSYTHLDVYKRQF